MKRKILCLQSDDSIVLGTQDEHSRRTPTNYENINYHIPFLSLRWNVENCILLKAIGTLVDIPFNKTHPIRNVDASVNRDIKMCSGRYNYIVIINVKNSRESDDYQRLFN